MKRCLRVNLVGHLNTLNQASILRDIIRRNTTEDPGLANHLSGFRINDDCSPGRGAGITPGSAIRLDNQS
jgi:hypothetical protein